MGLVELLLQGQKIQSKVLLPQLNGAACDGVPTGQVQASNRPNRGTGVRPVDFFHELYQ